MRRLVSRRHFAILIVLICSAWTSAFAANVKLAWDANTETTLAGYRVYYGRASRTYEFPPIDVGNTTTCTVPLFNPGIYYFAVTAYDIYGLESGYSNEVFTTIDPGLAPVITSISPASEYAGGQKFTLTVNGNRFLDTAYIFWDDRLLTTTYVNYSQLIATIPANYIAAAGTASIVVINPLGGASNPVTFRINKAPTSTSVTNITTMLNPNGANVELRATISGQLIEAGTVTFQLKDGAISIGAPVTSSNLNNGVATALYPLPAAFPPKTYTIDASYSGGPNAEGSQGTGTLTVIVINPGPVPEITSISPASVYAGEQKFTLTVNGNRFLDTAYIRWDDWLLKTTYINYSQLIATIPATYIASAGTASIVVINPLGGASNPVNFRINKVPTSTAVTNISTRFNPYGANVELRATISGRLIETGTVTFQLKDGAISIGAPVTSSNLNNGVATAVYLLPAALLPKIYTIEGSYSGGPNAEGSQGTGTLTVSVDAINTLAAGLSPGGWDSKTTTGEGSLVTGYGLLNNTTPGNPVVFASFMYSPVVAGAPSSGNPKVESAEAAAAPTLVTETGVPAASPLSAARIFVEYSSMTDSGVALVNPSATDPALIRADFKNASGSTVASTMVQLLPKRHTALFSHQLAPNLPNPFLGTLTLTSIGNVFIAPGPFAALSLATATSGRGEFLYNTLPVANLNATSAGSSLIFPHIAAGEGNSTQILLMNPSSNKQSVGTISFYDNNGSPLALDFDGGGGRRSAIVFSLPPDGMTKLATLDAGPLRVGYAIVTFSGGSLPMGSLILRFRQRFGLVSQAGVSNATPTTGAQLFVEAARSPLYRDTGIAFVNPGTAPANLTLKLADTNGTMLTTNLVLGAKTHLAKFISELFPGKIPAEFRGVLDVTSSVPVASLTLRLTVNQRGETIYSTLPVADRNIPPAGRQIIPQFVNGDGYKTQFIMINAATTSGLVLLNLFEDNGNLVDTKIFP